MKTIPYVPNGANANTEYRTFRSADKKYLMDKLREVVELGNGCIQAPEQSLKSIGVKMKTPNRNIPRMGKIHNAKMNSIFSAAEGIVDNIENGTQRDFSNWTCDIVSASFKEMKNIFNDWEEVEFKQVDELPKHAQVHNPITSQTTLSDLFDLSEYKAIITFEKK
jgi:hypothetical protein